MSAPVWITGLGAVCTAGVGAEGLRAALYDPAPQLNPAPKAREGLSVPPALVFAEEFPAEAHVDRRLVRKASGLSRLALVAVSQAAQSAHLSEAEREAAGVVIGTSLGSSDYYLRFYEALLRRGPKGANAVLFTEGVFNAPSGHTSALLGVRGAGHTLVGGEEAGLSAALLARDRIVLGAFPAALCGGAEAYCDLALASLFHEGRVGAALGAPASEAPGAFAEGACALFLESEATGRARGAEPRALLLGGARARGTRHTPGPARAALLAACAEAQVSLADLDLVVGGGSGGPRSRAETEALAGLVRDGLRAALAAPLAHLGEGLAFGSAALLGSALLALEAQRVPPTPGGWAVPGLSAASPGSLKRVAVLATSDEGSAVALVLGAP